MKREKLLRSKQYGISTMKYNLLNLIGDFQRKNNLRDCDLAEKLAVSKSYVSQILNGTFDHKISKVAELAHACNAVPLLYFVDVDDFVKFDAENKIFEVYPVSRPSNVTFEERKNTNNEDKNSVVVTTTNVLSKMGKENDFVSFVYGKSKSEGNFIIPLNS